MLDRNASPVAAAGVRCSFVLQLFDVQKLRRLRAVYFRVTYQWFLCCGINKTLLWRLSSVVVQHVVQLRGNSAEADGGERLHHGWVVAARILLLRGRSVFATCVLLAEAPALESLVAHDGPPLAASFCFANWTVYVLVKPHLFACTLPTSVPTCWCCLFQVHT